MKDVRILGEKTEDQPGHEMVHFFPAVGSGPFRIVLEQFDVKAIQAAGGLDVESVFADLPDRGDAGQRQEKTKVVMKIGIVTGDRLAIDEVFRLEGFAIRGENELGLLRNGFWTFPQRLECAFHVSVRADLDMDVVALENTAEVGLIGTTAFQPLDRGGLVAERFEKCVREAISIERLLRELR